MARKTIITKDMEDHIKKFFTYDKGLLLWKEARYKAEQGSVADREASNGYRVLKFNLKGASVRIMSHRVIWFLSKEVWPENEIDHINSIRGDNRIENLREATRSQNIARKNTKPRALPRGVSYAYHTNKSNPYQAQIDNRGIGYFKTPEDAHEAYKKEFLKVYGKEWLYGGY